MTKRTFQRPRGTYDILPSEYEKWRRVISVFEQSCRNAGYGRIGTPAFEAEELFNRSVGESSEIIAKELYSFEDKSGNKLSLRPEGTAPVVRAYIENGLSNKPKPVKLYLIEPMFRYDRPQAGRYRQFVQAGVEVFGSKDPLIDAQVIALAARFYRSLGLEFSLQINSIGSPASRKKFTAKLVDYLMPHKSSLPELAQAQLNTNPLRILDSKDTKVQKLLQDGPVLIDYLDRESADHFASVLDWLDQFGVPYELNSQLVRGLDYYTGTLFEFWGSSTGAQNAIGGGGRYDLLIEELGGKSTAAVGFGLGIERILVELGKGLSEPAAQIYQYYLVSIGEEAKARALILEQLLLDGGVSALAEHPKRNLADQLARANKLNIHSCLIIGKKELIDETVIIKDMASGNQETLAQSKLVAELARRSSLSTP